MYCVNLVFVRMCAVVCFVLSCVLVAFGSGLCSCLFWFGPFAQNVNCLQLETITCKRKRALPSASILLASATVGVVKVAAEHVIVLVFTVNTVLVARILPKDAAIREVKADRAVGVASDFNYLSLSFKALVGDVRQSYWHPFWEQNFVSAFEL